jgi:hypothetical protein
MHHSLCTFKSSRIATRILDCRLCIVTLELDPKATGDRVDFDRDRIAKFLEFVSIDELSILGSCVLNNGWTMDHGHRDNCAAIVP